MDSSIPSHALPPFPKPLGSFRLVADATATLEWSPWHTRSRSQAVAAAAAADGFTLGQA